MLISYRFAGASLFKNPDVSRNMDFLFILHLLN